MFRSARHGAGSTTGALLTVVILMLVSASSLLAGNGNGGTKSITLASSPNTRTVQPGESASYNITVKSPDGYTGSVSLSVAGLPGNTSSAFSPATVTLTSGTTAANLTVTTTAATPEGTYNLSLKGTGGTIQSAVVGVELTVAAGKRAFTISGSPVMPLAPGSSSPIDLQLNNPNNGTLAVTNLTVSIAGIARTTQAITKNLPCTTADYELTQFSGSYPFTAVSGTSSLSGNGILQAKWPRIKMLNTSINQDGCKGATILFAYSGTGQGN
ncbi:hypothetical protein ACFVTE_21370 [Arthrobacter sp. NPDC058097]|uniref:COG1470 family protein n=1 Tax=Arthrobacter sp. NPDC058097 TaxID=3346340 RepID=UPI0036D9E276